MEWAQISRSKKYIRSCFGREIAREFYGNINQEIHWLSIDDDAIATKRALKDMMNYYSNALITHHRISSANLGLGRIGHAGFFKGKAREKLWKLPVDIIENEITYG